MKRCNIFLAAVLFFSVGIVSAVAEEPDDEDTRRETIYLLGNPVVTKGDQTFTQTVYDIANETILSETQTKYSGIVQTESGSNTETVWNKDDEDRIYDFSTSFAYSITKEIGMVGQNNGETELDSTEADSEASDNLQLSDNGAYAIFVFEKRAFKNVQNRPQITGGSSNRTAELKVDDYSRSPVSTPFMMLVFMFCFFVILVMATTVGIKLKD